MKRFILMAAAAALLAIPAAEAQKGNKEATLSKLEKSDADIANPKKNAKAATWINRGRVYYDAAAEPTANLFAPMETTLLKLSVGDPTSTEEVTLNGSKAIAWNYPYFIAYERDGKIVAWKQLQEIKEGALDTAIEAYNKAYELDPKQASKIKNGLEQISNYASILGNVSIEAGEYLTGAEAYLAAYKAQQCPAFGEADPALLYYAGYLSTERTIPNRSRAVHRRSTTRWPPVIPTRRAMSTTICSTAITARKTRMRPSSSRRRTHCWQVSRSSRRTRRFSTA
mgnify:CR=1 FL=1